MSDYSEDDVRRAAEIREWLIKQISDKQEEVDRLRTTLSIIDNLLKQGSFKAAASYSFAAPAAVAGISTPAVAQVQQTRQDAAPKQGMQPTLRNANGDVRPLKRAKDDFLLANAEVAANSVALVPAQGVSLNANTPPFKSFFLNRILDGMKARDAGKVGQGALRESDALDYRVEEDGGLIRRVVITNYRDKERLTEIFNTSAWVFTRMLEKQ